MAQKFSVPDCKDIKTNRGEGWERNECFPVPSARFNVTLPEAITGPLHLFARHTHQSMQNKTYSDLPSLAAVVAVTMPVVNTALGDSTPACAQ